MEKGKDKRPKSTKKKIFLVFYSYILIILIYTLIYSLIYFLNPFSFNFNSEIKAKNIQEQVSSTGKELKEDYLRESKKLKADTIKQNNQVIIKNHILQYDYVIEKDTFSFTDTSQINKKAEELVLSYERNKVKLLWSPLDFLYFSVITISTVGYGDILPNSTFVRIIVVSEIILGQFLLVFLLAIVLSDFSIIKKDDKEKSL